MPYFVRARLDCAVVIGCGLLRITETDDDEWCCPGPCRRGHPRTSSVLTGAVASRLLAGWPVVLWSRSTPRQSPRCEGCHVLRFEILVLACRKTCVSLRRGKCFTLLYAAGPVKKQLLHVQTQSMLVDLTNRDYVEIEWLLLSVNSVVESPACIRTVRCFPQGHRRLWGVQRCSQLT